MFRPDKTKFTNSNGQKYLRKLFVEESYTANDKSMVQYSYRDTDHPEYPSLYKLYMDFEDPTEYQFAETYLLDYNHWLDLCQCTWFQPIVERWRQNLELKIKEKTLKSIIQIAEDPDSKNQFEALKILLNAGWKDKSLKSPKRGRPSSEEVKGRLKEIAQEELSLAEEYKRVSGEA